MMKNKRQVDFSNTEIAFKSKSDLELRKAAFLFRTMSNSSVVHWASKGTLFALRLGLPFTKTVIRNTIYEQFCGGRSLQDCQPIVDKLYKNKVLTILDFGLEGKSNESDFDRVVQETISAIEFANSNAIVPAVSLKVSALAKNDLLEKYSSNKKLNKEEIARWEKLLERVDKIASAAFKNNVGVYIDAEESWIQEGIDETVIRLMQKYNTDRPTIYNTYQMYRNDKLAQLKKDHQIAKGKGYVFGAKIVRGAYMDKEREYAKNMGQASIIHKDKTATDSDYDEAIRYCVGNFETIAMCNATHNIKSCQLMADLIAEQKIPFNHVHLNFCQLYGMSDYITFNLADAGYNVAKYLPYGPVKDVIPYLIRRAQENTSVTGEMGRELRFIRGELDRRK